MNTEVENVKRRFSIVGNSPALINAIDRALKVAPIDLSVLVHGPSGAGKEVFPKIIHSYGPRKHAKYIAVNCGAIPEGTIDSELFGHEKGSFTGAISDRKGYFEEADGGTIFLDEVAELPLTTQARLLRVLESGEFLKVGSSKVQKTNIRIVAATNVDLRRAVREGRFREDLYYRLSTVVIDVPPLRDRGDDIVLLARKFAADFAEKYRTEPISFDKDARRLLMIYNWPGNVRQLKNIVEQLALFEAGKEIDRQLLGETMPRIADDENGLMQASGSHHNYEAERDMLWQTVMQLRMEIARLQEQIDHAPGRINVRLPEDDEPLVPFLNITPEAGDPAKILPAPTAHELPQYKLKEKRAIEEALNRLGNRKKVAEELNMSVRTLFRKINEYNIDTSDL